MTDTHEHWTYSVGRYTSFLYWPTFEAACDAAFSKTSHHEVVHVFTPDGPGIDVTRAEWEAQKSL